ncbi:MAG: gliding motility-associated C-terminal domain-containing protein [Ferruginibacter sp.]
MRKYFILILLTVLANGLFAQVINITSISTSGRFNSCTPSSAPVVTATLISNDGSSLNGNTLVCNDICGTTTLRVVLSNVQWNQTPGANWIHGLFFPSNAGVTISAIQMPAGWNSFTSCTGASCSAGQTGGQGFYFDGTSSNSCCSGASINDGIPNNNFGDVSVNCGATFAFRFDMSFCNREITGGNLNFQLTGTADGNTGCWGTADALTNTISFSIATQACPPLNNVPFTAAIVRDCSVVPANYYATLSGGCGNGNTVTWWDAPTGGTLLGTGNNFIYDPAGSACPAGTTLYASCCPASAANCIERIPVTITGTCPPAPLSNNSKTDPTCSYNDDGSISITPLSTGPYTVTLTGPGGPYIQTGAAPVIFNNLAAGTYNYSFTDASGCLGTGGPVVLNAPLPLTTPVNFVKPSCNADTDGKIIINPRGGRPPYQYSSNGGVSYQTGNSFSGLSAGSYTFRIKDANNCIKDTSVVLTEPAVLVASAQNPRPSNCVGNTGTILVSAAGGTSPYTYSINAGAAFQPGQTFTAPAIGVYNDVIVKDAKGCRDTTAVTVLLNDTMRLDLDPDEKVCAGSSRIIYPRINSVQDIKYSWSSPTAPGTIKDTTVKNAEVKPLDTAMYILHAKWGLCNRTDSIMVNVLHKPVADAGDNAAICFRTSATFNGSHSNSSGPVIYTWTPSSYLSAANTSSSVVSPPDAGTYSYTLTVQDDYGCGFLSSDQVSVLVTPPVPAYAGRDTIAVPGVPHQLFGAGGVQYTWSPANLLNNYAAQNPQAILFNDTRFTLEVMDMAGCRGWDTVLIKIYPGPDYHIPTAFTPDADGRNDIFKPIPSGIVKTDRFRVFNRWGQLLFETNEWLKGWDGRFQGRKQPAGTYVWDIRGKDRNGKIIEKRGTVILIH